MSSDGKATTTELNALHALIARELARKIRAREATAADMGAAIKFLQNNGIQANVVPGSPLDELASAVTEGLPFAGSEGPFTGH